MTDTAQTVALTDYMSEVELSLRLGFWILEQPGAARSVRIALDGACVKESFVTAFLAGWDHTEIGKCDWQGRYQRDGKTIVIHSTNSSVDGAQSVSDLEAAVNARRLRVECKAVTKRLQERVRLQSAIGQMMTIRDLGIDDLLAVAVPYSKGLARLRGQFMVAPLFQRTEIAIVLVQRDGSVDGLTLPPEFAQKLPEPIFTSKNL